MGSKQTQESKPSAETTLAARGLLLYLGLLNQLGTGRGIQQLPLNPALPGQGGGTFSSSALGGGGTGGGITGSPFNVNPAMLLPSGQPGPGNLPGTILPNFNNLLQLSGRSFFGSLDPNSLGRTFGLNQGGNQ